VYAWWIQMWRYNTSVSKLLHSGEKTLR